MRRRGGKQYFASWGQSDASRKVRLDLRYMRPWPQWAFQAYAMAHIQQSQPMESSRARDVDIARTAHHG